MGRITSLFLTLSLGGALLLGAIPAAAQEVVYMARMPGSDYCHMRFPAFREETLGWDQPVFQDASSGDIIDFYGPCSYDPRGNAEVSMQRDEWTRMHQDGDTE